MKNIKVLIAFLIAVFMVGILPTMAGDSPTVEVATVTAQAGETVDVEIAVKNNPGITSMKLNVAFGESLTLEEVAYNTEIPGTPILPQKTTSPVILNWANGLQNVSGDYLFATLTFTVAQDAPAGLHPVTVTYDPEDVFNCNLDNVDFAVVNGGVEVPDTGGDTEENKLMFRMLDWNGSSYYEHPDSRLVSNWDTNVNSGCPVWFYYGTEDNYEKVALEDISVSDGIELTVEGDVAHLHLAEFGSHEIIYTDADGVKHVLPVTAGLPGLSFYKDTTASEANYLYRKFTVTEENKTFYLVPRWGTLDNLQLSDNFAAIAEVDIAEDGSYAAITITGTPNGEWCELSADLVMENGQINSGWWAGLNIYNGTPHLMFRWAEWDETSQSWFEPADGAFRSSWNTSLASNSIVKFYFGTEGNCDAVGFSALSVIDADGETTDGIALEKDGVFTWMYAHALGSYKVVYTDADGKQYTMPITVELPNIGFYTSTEPSEETFVTSFAASRDNDTFYLVAINGKLNRVTLLDDFANIATVALSEDGSYAIITVTGTPEDRWYNVEVEYASDYGYTNTYRRGLRIEEAPVELTRAEVCMEIVEAMGWEYNGEAVSFTDVSETHAAYQAISILVDRGIVAGMGDGTFNPDAAMTREQMATVLCAVLGNEGELNEDILPGDVSGRWSAAFVCTVLSENLMWTDENGNFNPTATVMSTDVYFSKLPWLAGTGVLTGDYTVSDIGFSEDGSSLVWTASEAAQEDTENTIRYHVYISEDGVFWDNFGRTRNSSIPLTQVEPGTYTAFKVETWVNDVFVAGTEIDDLTLTVELGADTLPAATVSVSTTANEDGDYPVTISGLTPNTEFFFIARSHNWRGSHGNYSDDTGSATINVYGREMESHFADVTSIYLVQEVTGTTRSADAKSATVTLTNRGSWAHFNEHDEDDFASKAVSNVHVESRSDEPRLCWDAPTATFDGTVRYQIYLSENGGATWIHGTRTRGTDLYLMWMDPGVYNALRFVTLVDDIPVADCIVTDVTLTITHVTGASDLNVVMVPVEDSVYTLLVTGAQANTEYQIWVESEYGGSSTMLYTDSNGTVSETFDWWGEHFDDPDARYLIQQVTDSSVSADGTAASLTLTNCGNWANLADIVVDSDYFYDEEQQVSDLRFAWNGDLPWLYWNEPTAEADGERHYSVYASADAGETWTQFCTTGGNFAELVGLNCGTYNAFRVITLVNNIQVADVTAALTLTVTQGTAESNATAVIYAPEAGTTNFYTVSISGATVNSRVVFAMQNDYGSDYMSAWTDSNGSASFTMGYYWMQDYLENSGTFQLRQYSSSTIDGVSYDDENAVDRGTTASFVVTAAAWTDMSSVLKDAADLKDDTKKVTNIRFVEDEWNGFPYLAWDVPVDENGAAYSDLTYRVYYSTDNGANWRMFNHTDGPSSGLSHLDAGSTYIFKVATLSGGVEVAETVGSATLTITPEASEAADVSFLTEDGEFFDAVISGLTPGAIIRLRLHDEYGYSSLSATADEKGMVTFGGRNVSILDNYTTYSVQEIIPGTVTDTVASVTVKNLGSGDIVLEEAETFLVTFLDWDGNTLEQQAVKSGADAEAPADPYREGYEFTGWNGSYTNVTRDTAVYATYKKTAFAVYFYHDGKYTPAEVNDDGHVTPKNPVREGYEFLGWSTVPGSTVYWDFGTDTVTADLILYANWAEHAVSISVVADSAEILSVVDYADRSVDSARPGESLWINIKAPDGKLVTGVRFTYADGTAEIRPTYGLDSVYFYAPDQDVTLEAVTKTTYAVDITLAIPEGITVYSAWFYGPTDSVYQDVTGRTSFSFENLAIGTYYLELGYSADGGFYHYSTYPVEIDGTTDREELQVTIDPILNISGIVTNLSDVTSDDCYVELYDESGWWVSGCWVDPETGSFSLYGVNANSTYTVRIWSSSGSYLPISEGGTIEVGAEESVTGHEITLANASDVLVTIATGETNPAFEVYFDICKDGSWITGATASGENRTVHLQSGLISEPGTYTATLHYAYARNWTLLDFTPVSYTVEVTQDDIDNGVPAQFNLAYEYPASTNPDALTGYGNLVALDRSEAYPGNVVSLSIRYCNQSYAKLSNLSFRVDLPEGVKLYDNAVGKHTVETLSGYDSGSASVPLRLTADAEGTLKISVMASIDGGEEFLFGSAALTVPEFTLTAPAQAKAGEKFTVSGQAAPGSTVFIKNADTNLLVAVAQTTGTFYSAEITASSGTLRLIAQTASDSSDVITVDVSENEPLTATALYYNRAKANWNKKLNAFSFWQYVDLDLMGSDLYVDVTFNWTDEIEAVELTFCGQTHSATRSRNGRWVSETPFENWGGSGLKPIRARITTSDGTPIEMTVAYVNLLIDPSGVVYDESGNPLEGAVVTLQVLEDGMWVDWDAESFGDDNPRMTGADGKYGWMVPDGVYRVLVSRDGYEDYDSMAEYVDDNGSTIVVPPPQTNINVTMTRKTLNVTPMISEMGRVIVQSTAKIGDPVTVFGETNEGYRLIGLEVTDAEGNRIDVTADSNGDYRFVMPAYDVAVTGQYISVALPEVTITDNADGTISANVNNLNESAVIMIALYRENGQMLSIQYYDKDALINVGDAASARAFLLDDSGLCPISDGAIWTAEN